MHLRKPLPVANGLYGMFRIACLLLVVASSAPVWSQSDEPAVQTWNEILLEAIRNDLARPNVHARNLHHFSTGQYALQLLSEGLDGTAVDGTVAWPDAPDGIGTWSPGTTGHRDMMAAYAFRFISLRYAASPDWGETLGLLVNAFIDATGTIPNNLLNSSEAAAYGNSVAEAINAAYLADGANQQGNYANTCYEPVNDPLDVTEEGLCTFTLEDPNRWQPLSFGGSFVDQAGNETFQDVVPFSGANWGNVAPFALQANNASYLERDGCTYPVYFDPGPPSLLGEADESLYNWQNGFALVARWQTQLNIDDGVMVDISPRSIGNLNADPDFPDYLYNQVEGGDIGPGHAFNPVTGMPYEPEQVLRGDFTRVLAEFWADGPDSETPPGHWFTILNEATAHPDFDWRWNGRGEPLSHDAWLARAYRLLGGAMHDAAIATWSIKGYYDFVRPISAIRFMLTKGQCSDPALGNFDPQGVPLIENVFEIIEAGDPILAEEPQALGMVKVHQWVPNPDTGVPAFEWRTGCSWWPYQRPTFVTPPFAGYVSGHSTYSRAAAEVLAHATGSAYFPGGLGTFEVEANNFLAFESGPSESFTLQWATYRDAADQCALSRIWGGIHPPMDDIRARVIGSQVADLAIAAYEEEAAALLTPPVVCPEDIDANGNVGTGDLLLLLSKYGEDCAE